MELIDKTATAVDTSTLNEEALKLLGDDPTKTKAQSGIIRSELLIRWSNWKLKICILSTHFLNLRLNDIHILLIRQRVPPIKNTEDSEGGSVGSVSASCTEDPEFDSRPMPSVIVAPLCL